ncbi:MAG: hypothetical protein ACKPKO_29785, partial [Candidatus Fonsibacter sp.]
MDLAYPIITGGDGAAASGDATSAPHSPSHRDSGTVELLMGTQSRDEEVPPAQQTAEIAPYSDPVRVDALNLSPHPHPKRLQPPSTGRSRTPLEERAKFGLFRTKGHEALLIAMMGCDPEIKLIEWAYIMVLQLDPITEDEAIWRASYS